MIMQSFYRNKNNEKVAHIIDEYNDAKNHCYKISDNGAFYGQLIEENCQFPELLIEKWHSLDLNSPIYPEYFKVAVSANDA